MSKRRNAAGGDGSAANVKQVDAHGEVVEDSISQELGGQEPEAAGTSVAGRPVDEKAGERDASGSAPEQPETDELDPEEQAGTTARTAAADAGKSDGVRSGTPGARATPRVRRGVLALVALGVSALLLAGAVVWFVLAEHTHTVTGASAERDGALDAARSIAGTLTTVDGKNVNGTLDAWNGVVTGPLGDQFANSKAQLEQRASQSQASVNSTVSNAALTQFDDQAGTAVALVFVDATTRSTDPAAVAAPGVSTPAPVPSGPASSTAAPAPNDGSSASPQPSAAATTTAPPTDDSRTQRFALTMTLNRVDGTWKASELQPVAQGGSQ